jgi:hypothetical protein
VLRLLVLVLVLEHEVEQGEKLAVVEDVARALDLDLDHGTVLDLREGCRRHVITRHQPAKILAKVMRRRHGSGDLLPAIFVDLAVPSAVAGAAQPDHVERLGVILVVGLDVDRAPAPLAWLRDQ